MVSTEPQSIRFLIQVSRWSQNFLCDQPLIIKQKYVSPVWYESGSWKLLTVTGGNWLLPKPPCHCLIHYQTASMTVTCHKRTPFTLWAVVKNTQYVGILCEVNRHKKGGGQYDNLCNYIITGTLFFVPSQNVHRPLNITLSGALGNKPSLICNGPNSWSGVGWTKCWHAYW